MPDDSAPDAPVRSGPATDRAGLLFWLAVGLAGVLVEWVARRPDTLAGALGPAGRAIGAGLAALLLARWAGLTDGGARGRRWFLAVWAAAVAVGLWLAR